MEDEEEVILRCIEAGATEFLRFAGGHIALLEQIIDRSVSLYRYQRDKEATELQLETLNRRLSENLAILEQDQRAGYRVQQAMMPVEKAELRGYTFDYRLFPSLILSGDFIDYFEMSDGRTLFYIADVAGHGVIVHPASDDATEPAALLSDRLM